MYTLRKMITALVWLDVFVIWHLILMLWIAVDKWQYHLKSLSDFFCESSTTFPKHFVEFSSIKWSGQCAVREGGGPRGDCRPMSNKSASCYAARQRYFVRPSCSCISVCGLYMDNLQWILTLHVLCFPVVLWSEHQYSLDTMLALYWPKWFNLCRDEELLR